MESQNYGHRHPLLLLLNEDQRIVANCSSCGEKVSTPCFSCAQDCGFYLHKVCAEAPLELNHPFHLDHTLLLMQAPPYPVICNFCYEICKKFVYHCSCDFDLHIKCALFTLNMAENNLKELEHVALQDPLISTENGDYVAISLWSIIGALHCHVSSKAGSMIISFFTNISFRMNLEVQTAPFVMMKPIQKDKHSYSIVSLENEDEIPNESSISDIERNDAGEATKIKHFKHMHNLMLSPFVGGDENNCKGCMLPISDPFYYCSECGFFLHKACADLPKMMNVWHHNCQEPLALISDKAFKCQHCYNISNAFAYECCGCEEKICLRCVIALTPGAQTCLKHEHPLFFYRGHKGKCNACGQPEAVLRCKDCNFGLHVDCFSLSNTAGYKCDERLFSLTNHDDNNYSKSHHCDICEKSRDPNC
ncbi:paxillin-B-like [Gossypium hirsutum]|uniref:Paxillin-B-like n=1 Tax=Gossypium hirsutum TaxID=3635 RepID=A0ABM2ZY27_GOSHI|nr:paxillin-B-like [Gossypium hirsutum]